MQAGLLNNVEHTISDDYLRRYNLYACVLHFIQGVLMLVASQAVPTIKSFSKQVTRAFLVFDPAKQALVPGSADVFTLEIGAMAAAFLLLSSIAHFIVLVNFKKYLRDINNEINVVRWYEYALSSSVMICAIATLFGCYDLGSLILIFILNAIMNIFGLIMEKMNPRDRLEVDWSPFWYGCIAGAGPWIVIALYFFGGGNFDQIPGFVYGILGSYFFFFNTFPVNMYLQYARIGAWKDYRHGERWYILLSLLSKSLLAWLVFGGCFQPNGNGK